MDISACRRLILAVLNQAIMDLHSRGKAKFAQLHKDNARGWLFHERAHINKIMSAAWCCLMLDMDLKVLRESARLGKFHKAEHRGRQVFEIDWGLDNGG